MKIILASTVLALAATVSHAQTTALDLALAQTPVPCEGNIASARFETDDSVRRFCACSASRPVCSVTPRPALRRPTSVSLGQSLVSVLWARHSAFRVAAVVRRPPTPSNRTSPFSGAP